MTGVFDPVGAGSVLTVATAPQQPVVPSSSATRCSPVCTQCHGASTQHHSEDVAGPSSSKSQAKPCQSTTLRELFKGSLQTIPALQDIGALANKNPPRYCPIAMCNEVLPAQRNLNRCVRCSIQDWKRRKLSLDSLQSTTSPATNTSTRSDGEDTSPPSSPGKGCSMGPTRPIPGWDSDLTELSSSNSDTESMADACPESDCELSWPNGDTTSLRIHIPLLSTRLPPGSSLRKCGLKRCNIAVPRDHKWKMCDPCRRSQRLYQKMRFENLRKSILGLGESRTPYRYRRRCSPTPETYESSTSLTLETSRPCSVRSCQRRIPLPEVYRWKTCVRCRAKARQEARRKRDAQIVARDTLHQPNVVPHFPLFQNREALLSSFDAQLKDFVECQIMYFRAKLHVDAESWRPEHSPMVFVFVGEYSIVAGQRQEGEEDADDDGYTMVSNDSMDIEAMRQEVSSIVLQLACMLQATFRAGEAFSIDKGGIMMQFTCSLQLISRLRPPSPASSSDCEANMSSDDPPNTVIVPLIKMLSGELETVVVPDESHRLFRGRRMVVWYRMIG